MYFVVTTMYNTSPSYIIEMLERVMKIFKDFCGVLTEEAIRKNFILIYEILDEVIDGGHPQIMGTELIKPFIVSEPVVLDYQKKIIKSSFRPSIFSSNTKPANSITRPLGTGSKKNEIFVDIFEKLTVLFNSNGYIVNSAIDGFIQMKSYLLGNPELRLAFNDDLVVGRNVSSAINAVILDDCNFHENVNYKDFEMSKSLTISPPDGEFVCMNYRITGDFTAPFRIYPFIDELSNYKLQLILKVRGCFPDDRNATGITIKFAVPRKSASISFELQKAAPGQKANYNNIGKMVEWTLKRMQGGQEHTLITKISLDTPDASIVRKEIGPIGMNFEIPMYNVSNLSVRHLRIADKDKKSIPYKWVRYVTQASSYVCRC